jgi:hypothetical protein
MNLGENPTLNEEVESDNELKTWLVNYVGKRLEKLDPSNGSPPAENNQVTVENIVAVMAADFPEFLWVVAEENWVRGYHQALVDSDEGFKLREAEMEKKKKCKNGDCGKCE